MPLDVVVERDEFFVVAPAQAVLGPHRLKEVQMRRACETGRDEKAARERPVKLTEGP